jgi:hypothetical protein
LPPIKAPARIIRNSCLENNCCLLFIFRFHILK